MKQAINKRIALSLAGLSVLSIMLFTVCDSGRTNPLDARGSNYVPPSIIIDTTGANVDNGDTVSTDSVNIAVSGNRAECRFRASLDAVSWTPWQPSGVFLFGSLTPGNQLVTIEATYDGGDVIVEKTIKFFARSPKSKVKTLTSFVFASQQATGAINEPGMAVAVNVPYGTEVTSLIATFLTAGVSVKVGTAVQTSGTTPNNFKSPVTYTVTAEDGTTQDYQVTVTVSANTAKVLSTFGFLSPEVVGIVNDTAKTIAVNVPYGTEVTSLIATFLTTGVSVKVGTAVQTSGTTPNNFKSPVTYTVTAEDGTTQDYQVTVTVSDNTAKVLSSFGFVSPDVVGVVNETAKTIAVNVPYGTDVESLIATFFTTGVSVKVSTEDQTSGTTPNNFKSPVTYTVTAEDGTTQDYQITVTVSDDTAKVLSSFGFVSPEVVGVVNETAKAIAVNVPYGTDVESLIATFFTTGVSVKVSTEDQTSGSTPNNFTNSVTYTVTAADGSMQDYVVTVTAASPKQITLLTIAGVEIPVTGATPASTVTETEQYTGSVSWSASPVKFAAATDYSATIVLVAKTGFTFEGVAVNRFVVPGSSTAVYVVNSGVVTAHFPRTAAVINITTLQGLVAPITGAPPVTTITATDQYTGTVSWSPSVVSTFQEATVYTGTVTLTPTTGFTLTGAETDIFKVAGATSTTNPLNSGVITAQFPTTATIVNMEKITGVAAPVRGEIPVTKITATAQYGGTVSWTPSVLTTFLGSTVYTATINLVPATGFTFSGVTADFFKIANATATNAASTVTVSAEFEATDNDYTSTNIGTLKYVPGGTFQRDDTVDNISTVSAFRMSIHEITRAQFLAIMGTDPSVEGSSTGQSDPVQNVNWYHAVAYCNKLSIKEGLTAVYSVTDVDFSTLSYENIPVSNNTNWNAATATMTNTGYRLPTEMEWMWAAMGATAGGVTVATTGHSKAFSGDNGSNALGDYAWYRINSGTTTHPVGEKLPNELGLFDMSGNVWEWCHDWYGAYPDGAAPVNYTGAATGTNRILRGGRWNYHAWYCTVALRNYYFLNYQFDYFGFRVVRL